MSNIPIAVQEIDFDEEIIASVRIEEGAIAQEHADVAMPLELADPTPADPLPAPTSLPATENAEVKDDMDTDVDTGEMKNATAITDNNAVADVAEGKIRVFVSPNNHLLSPAVKDADDSNPIVEHNASEAIISIAQPMPEDTIEDIDIEPVVREAIQPQPVVSAMQDAIPAVVAKKLVVSVAPQAFVRCPHCKDSDEDFDDFFPK